MHCGHCLAAASMRASAFRRALVSTMRTLSGLMDRLWAIKAKEGKDELTGNEYAKMLLERTLNRLHPEKAVIEEQ